jgi:ubiquinone/menaquinone biosynthesis C-methylase UbiE
MNELDLIIDLHRNSERQGPGSEKETLKALQLIDFSNNPDLRILDLGCGSGGQTITLAQNINGQVTAVDLCSIFLDELHEKSEKLGLREKIETLQRSMQDLPFGKAAFDIIWSEGAIYNVGFENGIREWRDYLRIGGYLAVSEITWITNTRPREIEKFWTEQYSEIDLASRKIKIVEENGFTLSGYFYLSQDSWIKNYYKPMEARFPSFLERHNNAELAKDVVREHEREIELYQKYKDYFSYGFYVARRNE